MFRSVLIRPGQDFWTPDQLFQLLGLHRSTQKELMLFDVPAVAVILDGATIVWEPTLYLAYQSLSSRSATGDGVRTCSEALSPWLRFLKGRNCEIHAATEMLLKVYRNELTRKAQMSPSRGFGSATIALRVHRLIRWPRFPLSVPQQVGGHWPTYISRPCIPALPNRKHDVGLR